MRKNEITLQEMFSTIVEELREMGNGTHLSGLLKCVLRIHQLSGATSAEVKPYGTQTLRKPPATKELQLEYGIYLH